MTTPCQFTVNNSDRTNITYTYPPSINPNTYGLTDFGLIVDYDQIEENRILISIEARNGALDVATVILNNDQTAIIAVQGATSMVNIAGPAGNSFALTYRQSPTSVTTAVTWNLAYDSNLSSIIGVKTVTICPILLDDGSDVFPSPTDDKTMITIIARRTPDGQELCQVNLIVTDPYPDCCLAATTTVQEYVLYCPKISSVLCAEGCTLGEKVQQLSLKLNISYDVLFRNLTEYSLLRLALSKLLYGSFDVNYLRQRYYKEFIRDVARCYPGFLQVFDGSNPDYPYRTYWSLFKC